MNRQKGITIYPDSNLRKIIEREALKQKRSINNFILYFLEENIKQKELLQTLNKNLKYR